MRLALVNVAVMVGLVGVSHAQLRCSIAPADVFAPIIKPPDQVLKKPADYFLLSLSWSPQFCTTKPGKAPQNAFQCRENSFGFVVHGFWPEAADAKNDHDHPRNCHDTAPIVQDTLRKYLCRSEEHTS